MTTQPRRRCCGNAFSNDIQPLTDVDGGTEATLYDDVPNGWLNRAKLSFARKQAGDVQH